MSGFLEITVIAPGNGAVALMHEPEDKEFPVAGTRAAKELHISFAEGPGKFLSYHAEWLHSSGVSGRNSAAHVHRNICEILRLLHSYDQMDVSSLATGETLCRWLIQTELAVERSPTIVASTEAASGHELQGPECPRFSTSTDEFSHLCPGSDNLCSGICHGGHLETGQPAR